MKKLFLTLCVAFIGVSAFAQKGETAVGINLMYGTEISNLGIGAKAQYNFTDAIRGEASFNYFLEKDAMKMWDININAHYLFPVANKLKLYPLVGVTYTNWNLGSSILSDIENELKDMYDDWGIPSDDAEDFDSGSNSKGKFGANLGAGVQYDLSDKFAIGLEVKYQLVSDFNQVVFGIGGTYKF